MAPQDFKVVDRQKIHQATVKILLTAYKKTTETSRKTRERAPDGWKDREIIVNHRNSLPVKQEFSRFHTICFQLEENTGP